jgi:hypothetical protein
MARRLSTISNRQAKSIAPHAVRQSIRKMFYRRQLPDSDALVFSAAPVKSTTGF